MSYLCKKHYTPIIGQYSIAYQVSSIIVVQLPSCVGLFVTPWTAARQASLSLTISWSLPKFMFIASVMPSSHFIFWLDEMVSWVPRLTLLDLQMCSWNGTHLYVRDFLYWQSIITGFKPKSAGQFPEASFMKCYLYFYSMIDCLPSIGLSFSQFYFLFFFNFILFLNFT